MMDLYLCCKMRGRVCALVDLDCVCWSQYDARALHGPGGDGCDGWSLVEMHEFFALLCGPVGEGVLDPRPAVPDIADGPRGDTVLCVHV